MKTNLIAAAIMIIVVGGVYYYLSGKADERTEMTVDHNMHSTSTHSASSTVPTLSERAFIEGMIPHHEEAVTSARAVLQRGGTTKEVRNLAQAIILAQDDEISSMKSWYEAWYGVPYKDTGTYEPMMRDLSTLSGLSLDLAFLEDMVNHHLHAIAMAHEVAQGTPKPEILSLAQSIASSQSNEIVTMKVLARQLASSTEPL